MIKIKNLKHLDTLKHMPTGKYWSVINTAIVMIHPGLTLEVVTLEHDRELIARVENDLKHFVKK